MYVCGTLKDLKAHGSNHPSNTSFTNRVMNSVICALELGSQKGRDLQKTTSCKFTVFVGGDLKILIHRGLDCITVPNYCCLPLIGYGL